MRFHKTIFNSVMRAYLNNRHKRIDYIREKPLEAQQKLFEYLISKAVDTEWGTSHDFSRLNTQKDFQKANPLTDYDYLKEDIFRMMHGTKNVLWPGKTRFFAKSAGTTNDKSKYIPVTEEKLKDNHIASSWDALSILYALNPESKVFKDKNLLMGGSICTFDEHKETLIGDVSAIMLHNMPAVGKPFYTPDYETAVLDDWEEKIDKMVSKCVDQQVSMLSGVPSWTLVLFKKILEKTGKENIHEVWPNLVAYLHGGVSFVPYKQQFEKFLPNTPVNYLEVYNASEGYFGIQDKREKDDMLLLVDNGVFYEFIPYGEWESEHPETILLEDVEIGKPYALVVSTIAGLWRYQIGDTIVFTSIMPYRIKITGRTKQFINVFGEELMVANTDRALEITCSALQAAVNEYTVAPIYFDNQKSGGHQWIIEFDKPPANLEAFSKKLDKTLQELNSDYEAKRFKNLILQEVKLIQVPEGTFWKWMKKRKKIGGQNKVPRLSNSRKYVDEILSMIK